MPIFSARCGRGHGVRVPIHHHFAELPSELFAFSFNERCFNLETRRRLRPRQTVDIPTSSFSQFPVAVAIVRGTRALFGGSRLFEMFLARNYDFAQLFSDTNRLSSRLLTGFARVMTDYFRPNAVVEIDFSVPTIASGLLISWRWHSTFRVRNRKVQTSTVLQRGRTRVQNIAVAIRKPATGRNQQPDMIAEVFFCSGSEFEPRADGHREILASLQLRQAITGFTVPALLN